VLVLDYDNWEIPEAVRFDEVQAELVKKLEALQKKESSADKGSSNEL